MLVPSGRYVRPAGGGEGGAVYRVGLVLGAGFGRRAFGAPFRSAAMHVVESLWHARARQRAHIDGLGLLEELRYVGRGDGVADQT